MFNVLTSNRGPYHPLLAVTLLICATFGAGLGAAEKGWQPLQEAPQQGKNDPRAYQAIQLANGIKVLLVSDPESPNAMVGLKVAAGSMQDPAAQPGLAHFLEHAIVLGTQKYPEGFSNLFGAQTGGNETRFSAIVNNHSLSLTLEKLADAIANPLLDPNRTVAELQAIDNESSIRSNEDWLRLLQVRKELLNQHHPFTQFWEGNAHTLSDKPGSKLQEELKKFHEHYYSANLISLVVYGNQPLEVLRYFVLQSFSPITNRQTKLPDITTPLVDKQQLGTLTRVKSRKQINWLVISFPIDPVVPREKNIYGYLRYLVAQRATGAVADRLTKEGLIEDLDLRYDSEGAGNCGLLDIVISLTEKGAAQRDRVIAATFDYLRLIEKEGIKQTYFDELSKISGWRFHYAAVEHQIGYVHSLLNNLSNEAPKNILHGALAGTFDPVEIRKRLAQLVPERALIFFVGPEEPIKSKSKFYQVPFKREKINKSQRETWQQLGQKIASKLPPLNPYLPDDFSLVPRTMEGKKPQEINTNNGVPHSFFMPSQSVANLPKAHVTLALGDNVRPTQLAAQVKSTILSELFWRASEGLRHQASVAGISYSGGDNWVSVNGFSQNLPLLLQKYVSCYNDFDFTESELQEVKVYYRKMVENRDKGQPHEQADRLVNRLSLGYQSEKDQELEIATAVTREEMLAYRRQLIAKINPKILAIGNLSAEQVIHLASALQTHLRSPQDVAQKNSVPQQAADQNAPEAKDPAPQQTASTEVGHGKGSENKQIVVRSMKALLNLTTSGSDSALNALYIPAGYGKKDSDVKSYVLAKILHDWFFEKLRTEEQLGYLAYVSNFKFGEQYGLYFVLQSKDKSPAQIYQRYEEFYQQAWRWLQRLQDPHEFYSWQRYLLKQLEEKPTNLAWEANRFREDFLDGNTAFDSQEQLYQSIKQLNANDLLTFYQKAVLEPNGLALLCQVQGERGPGDAAPPKGPLAAPEGWQSYATVAEMRDAIFPKVATSQVVNEKQDKP